MSKTYIISDHHFQHRGILRFEPIYRPFKDIEDHDMWLIEQHNSVVQDGDLTIFGGDVCFRGCANRVGHYLNIMKGRKHLIMGNHDNEKTEFYTKYFEKILGTHSNGEVLVTHYPIHEDEFQWRTNFNLHGHIHGRKLNDKRYINMSIEHCNGVPRTIEQWLENQ